MAAADESVKSLERNSGSARVEDWPWKRFDSLEILHPIGRAGQAILVNRELEGPRSERRLELVLRARRSSILSAELTRLLAKVELRRLLHLFEREGARNRRRNSSY